MTELVLDASVAVKWFLPAPNEPFSTEALTLYERYLRRELNFMVPDIFWAEIGSVFRKSIRQGRVQKAEAEGSITDLMKCNFSSISSATLLKKAFDIAISFDRSVYDSLYVSLAVQTKTELITADERLANALAVHFPVRWLGSSPFGP